MLGKESSDSKFHVFRELSEGLAHLLPCRDVANHPVREVIMKPSLEDMLACPECKARIKYAFRDWFKSYESSKKCPAAHLEAGESEIGVAIRCPECGTDVDEQFRRWLKYTGTAPDSLYSDIVAFLTQTSGKESTFEERLEDLLSRLDGVDSRKGVPVKDFFKWRMQAQWFLSQHLGENHPYTLEFVAVVRREPDPYSNTREIAAGKGILEALRDDLSGWKCCA